MLPEIRAAIEARDEGAARLAVQRTAAPLRLMTEAVRGLRAMAAVDPPSSE